MSSRPLDAILFDLDGTLVASLDQWVEIFLERLEAWGVHGYTEDQYFERVYSRNAALPDVLDEVGIGREHTDRFRAERDAIYLARLEAEAEWIGAARAVLVDLGARMAVGIVTQAWRSYVDAMDRRLGIRALVETILTCEDLGLRPKPDPYGLLRAAEALHVRPDRCAYVGDQPLDVEAAQRAGMMSVLIPRSTTRRMPVREPDHVLRSIDQLPRLLDPS